MKDFVFYNPDRIYFGKNQLCHLCDEIKKYGTKVLLVYGGGSIKRNGLYDEIISLLNGEKIEVFELSGVEPNPRHTTANKGAKICKDNKIDLILAVGGGSTIDCSKAIAATAKADTDDCWTIVKQRFYTGEALPLIAVLTNAATGSEMDRWAVISNMETNEKLGLGGTNLLPVCAFENPEITFSLPKYQTACGAFDIFNHVLDNYYLAGENTFDLMLEFQEAVMRCVVKYAPIAMKEPNNYEARANLMWASSMALNDVLDGGTLHDCACHAMEHELSAYYDITHGHGLAILAPRWLTYILDDTTVPAIARFGEKVFEVPQTGNATEDAKKAIDALSKFCFETLELSSTLTSLSIDEEHFKAMAKHSCKGTVINGPKVLTPEDVEKIYRMCL